MTNIKGRIHARKILLVYFYEQYFLSLAGDKTSMISNIDKIKKIVANPDDDDSEDIDLSEVLKGDYYSDFDKEIPYIVDNYFEKIATKDIDFEYIKAIGSKFFDYQEDVRTAVNKYAVSFGYDDMDIMDRVIFILGYIEYVELKTPKEIVLNEMVELGKRYGDESSSKLLNGIGHKIFAGLEK